MEILTLIPLDLNFRSSVKGRKVFRRGLLASGKYDMGELNRKQKKLEISFKSIIEREYNGLPINEKVLQVLEGMLKFDRKKRISAR